MEEDRQKLSIRKINQYSIAVLSALFIANIIVDVLNGKLSSYYSISRLFLTILAQLLSYGLSFRSNYRLSAGITLGSLAAATLLYPLFRVPVIPVDIIIIFFLLTMLSILPYLAFELNKDKHYIFGSIAFMVISATAGVIVGINKLTSNPAYRDVMNLINDEKMIPIAYVGSLIFLHYVVYRFRRNNLMLANALEYTNARLRKEVDLVEKSQYKIEEQNEELREIQKELEAMNESLEFTVKQRTAELEDKNREMLKYAFMNSHMLRGPIARLKGLLNIKNAIKPEDLKGYMEKTVADLAKTTTVIGQVVQNSDKHSIEEIELRVEQLYGARFSDN